MKLLILGGPKFLGRHLADAALARGHSLTFFNRGQTNPDLYPEVEKLRGHRDGDLAALRGRQWDAVIDTCGYVPRLVRAAAQLLAESVEHYTFVSSLSVYADTRTPGPDESAPVGKLDDETIEQITGDTYGPLKVLCEQAAEEALPGRVLHVRAQRGGQILAPGNPLSPVQFVDVRDLADWMVRMAEQRRAGVFNATGPAQPLPMRQFLEACQTGSGAPFQLVWVDENVILDRGLAPWMEVPLWIPDSDPQAPGFSTFNCRKAMDAGLTFRPLTDTLRDTLAWANTRPADHQWRAGLTPEREALALPPAA